MTTIPILGRLQFTRDTTTIDMSRGWQAMNLMLARRRMALPTAQYTLRPTRRTLRNITSSRSEVPSSADDSRDRPEVRGLVLNSLPHYRLRS